MINQVTIVTAINDTSIGCSTHTPTEVDSRPVMIGNSDPPICAKTKARASAVDLVSEGNSLEPTDIACDLDVSPWVSKIRPLGRLLQRRIADPKRNRTH